MEGPFLFVGTVRTAGVRNAGDILYRGVVRLADDASVRVSWNRVDGALQKRFLPSMSQTDDKVNRIHLGAVFVALAWALSCQQSVRVQHDDDDYRECFPRGGALSARIAARETMNTVVQQFRDGVKVFRWG